MNHLGQSLRQSLPNSSSEKGNEALRQHAAHKARRERLARGNNWRGINPEPFWSQMWMWELVEFKHRDWDTIKRPAIIDVIKATASYYGLALDEMLADRRTHDIMVPRQVAMYLSRKLTLKSFPQIGHQFGGKDHSTILHGIRKIENQMRIFPHVRIAVETIQGRLGFNG